MINSSSNPTSKISLGSKSWLRYLGEFLIIAFAAIIMAPLPLMVMELSEISGGPSAVIAATLLVVAYRWFNLSGNELYMDDHGVWFKTGRLPWSLKFSHVPWLELADVAVSNGYANLKVNVRDLYLITYSGKNSWLIGFMNSTDDQIQTLRNSLQSRKERHQK